MAQTTLPDEVTHDTALDISLSALHDDQSAVDDGVTALLRASERYQHRGLPGEVMSTRAMVSVVLAADQRRRRRTGIRG